MLSYSEIKKERNHFMDVTKRKQYNIKEKTITKRLFIGGQIYFKIPVYRKLPEYSN